MHCDNVKSAGGGRGALPVANTYSFLLSHGFEDSVDALSALGFSRVEAMIGPGHLWPDALDAADRRALGRRLRGRGVELTTINQPNLDLNLVALDPAARDHARRRFEDAVRLAADLGCPAVVVGPGKANPLLPAPRERLRPWLVEALDGLAQVARPLGVRLLVENMPFAFLPRCDELVALADDLDGLDLGLVVDVANCWFAGEDPRAALERGGSRVALVHVSDTARDRYAHAPIGEGTVPWRDVALGYASLPAPVPVVAEIVSAAPLRDLADAFVRLGACGWPFPVPAREATA